MQQFTVGDIHEAIAETRPEAECLVFRDRTLTWSEVTNRTRRLANFLNDRGYGCHTERANLAQQESGQDHLAIYLHNGNEYLECMLGAFKGRVAPFNVNYRYVAEELIYLLNDSSASIIVYHSIFAPILESILPQVPLITMMLQVDDESGHDLLPGAMWYEDALLSSRADLPAPAL